MTEHGRGGGRFSLALGPLKKSIEVHEVCSNPKEGCSQATTLPLDLLLIASLHHAMGEDSAAQCC